MCNTPVGVQFTSAGVSIIRAAPHPTQRAAAATQLNLGVAAKQRMNARRRSRAGSLTLSPMYMRRGISVFGRNQPLRCKRGTPQPRFGQTRAYQHRLCRIVDTRCVRVMAAGVTRPSRIELTKRGRYPRLRQVLDCLRLSTVTRREFDERSNHLEQGLLLGAISS
jgi:hypothetical protein